MKPTFYGWFFIVQNLYGEKRGNNGGITQTTFPLLTLDMIRGDSRRTPAKSGVGIGVPDI